MSYRNVAIGVGVLCVVLLIALAYSVTTYTSMLQNKDAQISALDTQIANLGGQPDPNLGASDIDAQIANLQNQIADLQNQLTQKNADIDSLNAQIASLNSQINNLKAPKLISVNLKAEDTRPWLSTPYVHVYGYVVNVGTNTAYNAKVHVVLYQSGNVIAKDTYVDLGSIGGESSKSVDTNVYYEGSEITDQTVTLEWT